jgi:hypothetical protein
MWYHYLLLVVGLWFVATSIYNIVMSGNKAGWIVNGLSTAVGGAFAWYGWSGIFPPTPTLVLGGYSKWFK